jgi:DNA-directed RNA polymerase II subunit RPB1
MFAIRNIIGVDLERTMCNDIVEVYNIFGIEAARVALMTEIMTVMSNSGSELNYHHLSLIVDMMTRDGYMISMDRHGMGRTDAAPLGKISFEKPVEQLLNAAVYNETDPLNGVSARIMTGKIIKGGTGMCDLMMDLDMIQKSEYVETEHEITKEIIDDADETMVNEIIMNKLDETGFIPE